MTGDKLYQVCVVFVDGRKVLYQVTEYALEWLYESIIEKKGYWSFSSCGNEYFINLNNVNEIVKCEVKE